MNSYEIIQMHILFCEIRKYLENEFLPDISEEEFSSFFGEYERLGITPTKINRSLSEQKNAMKALGRCISNFMNSEYVAKKKPDTKIVKTKIEYALTPAEYLTTVN